MTQTTNNNIGIYQLTHLDSQKTYIGASQNLKARVYHHNRDLHLNRHHVSALQSDFNQSATGNNAVSFAVLEYCDFDQLHEREDFHIETKKPVYNTKAAGGGVRVITDEARENSRNRIIGKQMRYLGDFVTPWGVYSSSFRACSACEVRMSQFAVWKACRNPKTVITKLAYAKSLYLSSLHDRSVIGKTWAELGFGFVAKAEDDTGIKSVEISPSERAALIKKCGTELAENLDDMKQSTSQIKAIIKANKRHLN